MKNYSKVICIQLAILFPSFLMARSTMVLPVIPKMTAAESHKDNIEIRPALYLEKDEYWGEGFMKKCRKPLAGASPEVRHAINIFSLRNSTMRDYIAQSTLGKVSPELTRFIDDYEITARKYFATHDLKSCLGNSLDNVEDFCTTLVNWKQLKMKDDNKLMIPYGSENDSLYFVRNLDGNFQYARSAWSLYQQPSTLHNTLIGILGQNSMPLPRGRIQASVRDFMQSRDNSFIELEMYTLNAFDIEYRGWSTMDHEHQQKNINLPLKQIGLKSNSLCFGDLLNPKKVLETALKGNLDHFNINDRPGSNMDLALSLSEGTQRGLTNVAVATEEIPKNLIAVKQLVLNEEVPFCSEFADFPMKPSYCEGTFPCSDSSKGKSCIGAFTMAKRGLGEKAEEIATSCTSSICGKNFKNKCFKSVINLGRFQVCFQAEVYKKIGQAAYAKYKSCVGDAENMSICFAELAVAAAGAAATGGVENVAGVALSTGSAFIKSLLAAGKISSRSAMFLEKSMKLATKAGTFTVDVAANPLPKSPKDLQDILDFVTRKEVLKEATSRQKQIFSYIQSAAENKLKEHHHEYVDMKEDNRLPASVYQQYVELKAAQMDPYRQNGD